MNKVFLIGNLGKDPEVRHLENGSRVCKFTLATNESFTNRNSERITTTEWHYIEVWDRQAEVAEKLLRKGKRVFIEGKLKSDKFMDANGVEQHRRSIRCLHFELLDRENPGDGSFNRAYGSQQEPAGSSMEAAPIEPPF